MTDNKNRFGIGSRIPSAPRQLWQQHYRHIPLAQMRRLYMAVFCLFSTIALFLDLINLGERPYLIVILNAIACGIVALAYLVGEILPSRVSITAPHSSGLCAPVRRTVRSHIAAVGWTPLGPHVPDERQQ